MPQGLPRRDERKTMNESAKLEIGAETPEPGPDPRPDPGPPDPPRPDPGPPEPSPPLDPPEPLPPEPEIRVGAATQSRI